VIATDIAFDLAANAIESNEDVSLSTSRIENKILSEERENQFQIIQNEWKQKNDSENFV
jgi:hypothetical protein